MTRRRPALKRIQFSVSPEFDEMIESLIARTGSRSLAEMLRLSVTVLDYAVSARESELRVAVVDRRGQVMREIFVPRKDA